ncbi:uncharacterized protein V1510DRAFT_417924 [Dipodascopsis tothii]|uniref:uncharacterized protein n=1 Tax=Dipodascopsis tothii TaxID=44089 RepID=UPI0034CD1B50
MATPTLRQHPLAVRPAARRPVAALVALAALMAQPAAAVLSYCRCTCGGNSTLIALVNEPATSCVDCTRKFCADYNLPQCHDTAVDDVVTVCFERTSTKEQTIVVLFLVLTLSLLAMAGGRRALAAWRRSRGQPYTTL